MTIKSDNKKMLRQELLRQIAQLCDQYETATGNEEVIECVLDFTSTKCQKRPTRFAWNGERMLQITTRS